MFAFFMQSTKKWGSKRSFKRLISSVGDHEEAYGRGSSTSLKILIAVLGA